MTSLIIDRALAWYRTGCLGPDAELKALAAASPEFLARAKAVRTAFSGADGELALETLMAATLDRPMVDRTLSGEAATDYIARRDAEAGVGAMILFYLDTAMENERTTHAPDRPDRRPDSFWSGDYTSGPDPLAGLGDPDSGDGRGG